MKIKNLAPILLIALTLLFASNAFAQRQSFAVDPQASEVAFSLGATMHSVHGTFHVGSGAIDFDRSASTISGSIQVGAGSGNSGNDTRDKKMTDEILNATQFASVSFVPRSYQGAIAPSGDSTIQVTGTFTLHGTPHELTVPTQIHIDGNKCTAKAHLSIPFVKWGLKDPSTFMLKVEKNVEVDLTLVGRLTTTN